MNIDFFIERLEDIEKSVKIITKYLTTNLDKLDLLEQKKYYIRVRGIGKEQAKGKWATSEVDAGTYLIDNPIQNGIWTIRFTVGNFHANYFEEFDKLGYSQEFLQNNIDTIEIIPHNSNNVLWTKVIGNIDSGLQKYLNDKIDLNLYPKKLILRELKDYFYLIDNSQSSWGGAPSETQVYFNFNFFKDIEFVGKSAIKPKGSWRAITYNYTEIVKNVKNLQFYINDEIFINGVNDYAIFHVNNISDFTNNITVENGKVELNLTTSDKTLTVFRNINNIKNIKVKSSAVETIGIRVFSTCKGIENCFVENWMEFNSAFSNCKRMKNNKVTGTTNKYTNCYSSENINATYLIPNAGGDTPEAGWNT